MTHHSGFQEQRASVTTAQWMAQVQALEAENAALREQLAQARELREKAEGDRDQLAAALQATERNNRALLEAVPDLIVRLSSGGIYLDFIQAKNIELITEGDRVGKSVYEVLPPELAQQYVHATRRAIRTGETQTFEYQLQLHAAPRDYEARVVAAGPEEALLIVRDITKRKQTERSLRAEQERSEKLLLNILPQPIAAKLKQNQGAIAERFEEVTILFSDIVDFTGLSARVSPTELVDLLNEIFSTFDQLADRYNLEKIKTIGDAYMAVGGIPVPRSDHAEAIANMALDMQQAIGQFQRDDGELFRLRIGVSTGPVVAGVIGLKKFIYDLWGDAVNIASRMESQGVAGDIQVTHETYERLKDQFELEARGAIAVKGRGTMQTYWLRGRKS